MFCNFFYRFGSRIKMSFSAPLTPQPPDLPGHDGFRGQGGDATAAGERVPHAAVPKTCYDES